MKPRSQWRRDRERKGMALPPGAGAMGMRLALVSITVLFLSTIVAFAAVQYMVRSHPNYVPIPTHRLLPVTLWVSTALLFLSSWPLYSALSAVRRDDQQGLRRGLVLATVIGTAFVIAQIASWVELFFRLTQVEREGMQVFLFYMLTVTHGLHVIGGLIPMGITAKHAFAGHYDSLYHPAVRYCNWYWHYLGVVWAVLFALLMLYA